VTLESSGQTNRKLVFGAKKLEIIAQASHQSSTLKLKLAMVTPVAAIWYRNHVLAIETMTKPMA
jgi:hypothetical protein